MKDEGPSSKLSLLFETRNTSFLIQETIDRIVKTRKNWESEHGETDRFTNTQHDLSFSVFLSLLQSFSFLPPDCK
eukprot:scaffold954_cov173-Ochromonas_danica.AAC.10